MFKKILVTILSLIFLASCQSDIKIKEEEAKKIENIELTNDEEEIINEILEL